MAQSVRAILLASAIAASFFGLRASRLSNQGDAWPGLAKRITAVAPRTTSLRRASLPCRLMRPCRRLPPEELSFGVRPSHAAKCRPERKLLGSVTLRAKLTAPIGPIPGWLARHWLSGFSRCDAVSRVSISLSLTSSASS